MRRDRALRFVRDHRTRALALTFFAILVGGFALARLGGDPRAHPAEHAAARLDKEVEQRFLQGVVMLHARQYEHAATAFHRVLEMAPDLPEAHVNMGFALIGLERFAAARDFFESAVALRRDQANAYYGLALALEGLRDAPGAIGAMRTYLHLTRADDPYRRKAQAALWEWEAARGDGARDARPATKESTDAAGR
ncbi:MAG: hypothetical protein WBO23_14600 [Burkholderiales bacterium]